MPSSMTGQGLPVWRCTPHAYLDSVFPSPPPLSSLSRITNIIPPQKNVFVDEVDAAGEEEEEGECSEEGVPRLQVDAPS